MAYIPRATCYRHRAEFCVVSCSAVEEEEFIMLYDISDFDRPCNWFPLAESMALPAVSMQLHTSCDRNVELRKQQRQRYMPLCHS